MLAPLIIALPILSAGAMIDEFDRSALIKLIDAAQQASYQDVSFDYEGKQYVPGPIEQRSQELGPDGVALVYTGSFRRRSDGATLVDIYDLDKRIDRAEHNQIALLNGRTETTSLYADEKQAKISIGSHGPLEYAGRANYRRICMADWVRQFAESAYLYDYLGFKQLDGEECLVVRFRLALNESTSKNRQNSHTFWIDMNRGGNVVRQEHRRGEDLFGLTTARLEKFATKPGRFAWVPISGRHEGRVAIRDGKPKFLDEPVYYETYSMIPVTLKFNQGLKDSTFSVKAKPGDLVSDELRKAKYEFGQYMVRPKGTEKLPTDAEVKTNLDQMLKDSAVMASELKASSPQRDGPGWLSQWPWAFAGLSLAGIGFLYYRRRGA